MAYAYQGSFDSGSGNVTGTSQTCSATYAAGEHVFVRTNRQAAGTETLSDGTNTYTKLTTVVGPSGDTFSIWECVNTASGTFTLTMGLGTTSLYRGIQGVRYTGLSTGASLVVSSNTSPTTGADLVTSGNVTPGSQPGLLLGWVYNTNGSVANAGTGFTSRSTFTTESGANGCASRAEDKRLTATTAVPATFTSTVASDPFITFAIFAAESGGGAVLAAAPAAAATVTAALTTGIKLSASASALTSIAAAISTQIKLAAGVSVQSTLGAGITTAIKLASAAQAQSTVTAGLSTGIQLVAAIQAVSTVFAGFPGLAAALAASPAAAVTLTASLSTAIKLAATAQAAATMSAGLSTGIQLQAAAQVQATAAAALATSIKLAAGVIAQAQVSAGLSTSISLAANVAAQTLVTAFTSAPPLSGKSLYTVVVPAQSAMSVPAHASPASVQTQSAMRVDNAQNYIKV